MITPNVCSQKILDLHGIKHEDARRTMIEAVEHYWGTDTELNIITGYSNKMKDIVCTVLDEYKLDYKRGNLIDTQHAPIVVTWIT